MNQHPHVELVVDDEITLLIDKQLQVSWNTDSSLENLSNREISIINEMVEAGINYGKRLKADEISRALLIK